MNKIKVEHNPPEEKLRELKVASWPIWTKEISIFPWTYDRQETCYVLEGEVTVMPDSGELVRFGRGDLVTFPAGMSCVWEITQPVKKYYSLG